MVDDQPTFELDLPSLGVRGTWTPSPGEQRACAVIVRNLLPLEAEDGDQELRWHALRSTPDTGIAVLREAPPEDIGFGADGALQHGDGLRLVGILMDILPHLGDEDAGLRYADGDRFRGASERFERDVRELRRVLAEAAVDDGGPPTSIDRPRAGTPSALLRSVRSLLEQTGEADVQGVNVRPFSTRAPIVLELTAGPWTDDHPLLARIGGTAYTPTVERPGDPPTAAVRGTTGEGFALYAYRYAEPLVDLGRRRRFRRRRRKPGYEWQHRLGVLADFAERHLDPSSTLSINLGGGGYASIDVLDHDVPAVMSGLDDDPASEDRSGYRWGWLSGIKEGRIFVGGGDGSVAMHTPLDPCKATCNQVSAGRRPRRGATCLVVN